MRTDIFFADKLLILTDVTTATKGAYHLPSSELSRANVLKIFGNSNTIEVCDPAIDAVKERFFAEFKYVEAAGGIVCGRATILAEGDAANRDDLVYLERLPLFKKDGTPLN